MAARICLCVLGLLAAGASQAQTLDEIDLRAQGETLLLRIRFNASVRLLKMVPDTTTDLYSLRFEIIAADDAVLRQTTDEFRRLPAGQGLPEITVSYGVAPTHRVKELTIRLGRPLPVQARQGVNARSIELLLRPAGAAAGAGAASAPLFNTQAASPADAAASAAAADPKQLAIDREAAELIGEARAELDARRPEAAVVLLNRLLKLPPNRQSVAAQGLIGTAWERAGNPLRARIEFSLYLKLYPHGEDAGIVAEQLAALGGPLVPSGPAADSAAAKSGDARRRWTGTLAQYYYGGKARSQSLVNIATGIDQSTLSRTTESSIVTSLDLAARFDAWGGETRAVVRGSGANNLLDNSRSSSAIGAMYVEHHRRGNEGLALRIGRQSPISGGLLGLFDGVSLVYPLAAGIKLDVMGGVPASALVTAPDERLFAVVLEADSFLVHWGGNFYLLEQSTQGITNRRALGAELRYAGERWSTNTLVDYDALFGLVNALSVHGSLQVGPQTTLTVLGDVRRAPSLQLTNALISSGAASLQDLLRSRSLEQVRGDALATSAMARQLMLSVSRPIDERWQMSADLRYSAVGALPAVGDFEATAATGAQYSLSAQLTGINLYSKRDISNVNLSLISTPFFKGVQVSYNNLTGLNHNDHEWTLEPTARLYAQRDQQHVRLLRLGPGLRLTYRQSPRLSLLGELIYEASRTDGPTNHDSSNSIFFYIGYRYELF